MERRVLETGVRSFVVAGGLRLAVVVGHRSRLRAILAFGLPHVREVLHHLPLLIGRFAGRLRQQLKALPALANFAAADAALRNLVALFHLEYIQLEFLEVILIRLIVQCVHIYRLIFHF